MANPLRSDLILSWRLVDNIPPGSEFAAQERKVFCNSRKAKLTNIQMCSLRTMFLPLKDKYKFELQKAFFPETVHTGYFRLAGGNYSFAFVLPHVLEEIAEFNRLMPIHLKLYELRDDNDLLNEFEVAFSSKYKDSSGKDKKVTNFTNLKKMGFMYSKEYYTDEVRFATTKEVVQAMGSKEQVLKKHALIGMNSYSSSGDDRKKISTPYPTRPAGRTERPRVTSDNLIFNYELMKSSFGIWVLFKSQLISNEFEFLSEKPTVYIQRHFLYNAFMPDKTMLAAKKATFNYLTWVDKENEKN